MTIITFHYLSEFAPELKRLCSLIPLMTLYRARFSTWSREKISMETRSWE